MARTTARCSSLLASSETLPEALDLAEQRGQVRREPMDYRGYSDHRPDLTLLLDGVLTVFDLKVFDSIGSRADGQTSRWASGRRAEWRGTRPRG